MPFIESGQEFHARQGGQCIEVEGFLLYANGARCSRDGMERREPPEDPHEKARWVELYWERAVERAVERFRELKEQLAWAGKAAATHGDGTPSVDQLDRVRELRAEVRRQQRRLSAARAEVERTRPPADEERAVRKARSRQRGEEFLTELKGIRL